MALYIPHSIFHLARLLYVRPETFGTYYVSLLCALGTMHVNLEHVDEIVFARRHVLGSRVGLLILMKFSSICPRKKVTRPRRLGMSYGWWSEEWRRVHRAQVETVCFGVDCAFLNSFGCGIRPFRTSSLIMPKPLSRVQSGLTFRNYTLCLQKAFMCFVWISEQAATFAVLVFCNRDE